MLIAGRAALLNVPQLLGREPRVLFWAAVNDTPDKQPEKAKASRQQKRRTPGAKVAVEKQDQKWRDGAADGGAAVEHGDGPGALPVREPFGAGLGCARPVRSFAGAEQEAEEPESADSLCH